MDEPQSPVFSPRPVKVLHIITHLAMGGAEKVALSLAECGRPAVEPALFAVLTVPSTFSRVLSDRLAATGIPCRTGSRLPFKRGGLLASAWALKRQVDSFKPDIVHLHTEIPEAVWAAASRMSRRVRRTPVLRTIHNTQLWPKWGAFGRWAERSFTDQHVVGVSPRALEAWQAFRAAAGLDPLEASRVSVILNGVAAPRTAPARPSIRSPARVLVAGRLEPQKGVDLLPAIWREAQARCGTPATLTIVGAGSIEDLLRTEFNGDASVRMQPPTTDLAVEFERHDVLLMPSRFEGLALVPVEAMMAHLPVVAANVPGLREIFPGDYPFLAKAENVGAFADRLAAALHDRERDQSRAAFDHVRKHFSLDRVVDAYGVLYEAVAGV